MSSFVMMNSFAQKTSFTRQDSLRGNTKGERLLWDVKKYDLEIEPDIVNHTISGTQKITFDCKSKKVKSIQIDLMDPMVIDYVFCEGRSLPFSKEGNVYWIKLNHKKKSKNNVISIGFHGKPREAVNPPWDGGWIWSKDENGKPFVSVACQGLGASSWFPCKDTQSDEPDNGSSLTILVPDSLQAIGNGKLTRQLHKFSSGVSSYKWEVSSPINNYNIVPYIGDYRTISDTFQGLNGTLKLNYFVLLGNESKEMEHFKDVKKMLVAFEYWFGPYPFYEDEFKLVEAPHLGMEHQSAIAYGNQYKKGYLGTDLSGTGHGLGWDFIIIHESGHEWFGNNITSKDIADMWIHESFTNYSEALFIEYWYGKKAAGEYVAGLRNKIANDIPIIGPYGVNQEGSGDMYNKGGNMIHTIRQIIDNDNLFREILVGLNLTFKHKTVTTKEIEEYITIKSGKNLQSVFDQYLRDTGVPIFSYKIENDSTISYQWINIIEGFEMPLKIKINGEDEIWLTPKETEQKFVYQKGKVKTIIPDPGFYVLTLTSR